MSYPIFYVPAGDVLPILFDSFDGGTGASITLTGLAATDIEIYKDGSVTQRASDAGITLLDTDGIDFDTITGIHGFSIDTGDDTDAGFYAVGSWYHVVVSSVTIDAQTVNFIAAAFRIMAAEGVAGVPDVNMTHISDTAQTANDVGADVDAILVDTSTTIDDLVDDLESRLTATRAGYLDNLSAGAVALEATAQSILTDTGTTLDAALAVVDANVDAILVDTAVIGAAGAGLTAVPWNASWDAEVQSEVDDALGAAIADSIPADGTIPSVKQGVYMLVQFMLERSVSSTTLTVKKADGSTSLLTCTLNDATSPTSITRAS